jgi:threonine dehydrogenase-like Zn-dependent dehydrogenase
MAQSDVDAFFIDAELRMTVGTRRLAEPAPDEAIVRVKAAGVCGSDLHVMRSGDWVEEWPATLGHEIYGTVEQAPADGSLNAGDHVVADSRVPCGECPSCRSGDTDACTAVRFLGECRPGGFATHCVLPSSLLHRLPDDFQTPTAVLAEPLAVVLHGIAELRSQPARVAILGHGPIGALMNVQLRRSLPGIHISVAEPAELRADLARALDAHTVASAADLEPGAYDTVIDAAGYRGSLTDALKLVAPRGQVLVLALSRHPVELAPADLVENSAAIIGTNAFVGELPQAIHELAADPSAYEPVITKAISLAELPETAAAQLRAPVDVKVVVCP